MNLPDYKALHSVGFNIICYDIRNHGIGDQGSGGTCGALGYYEARDVVGSLTYARSRPDTKDSTIGLLSRVCRSIMPITPTTPPSVLLPPPKIIFPTIEDLAVGIWDIAGSSSVARSNSHRWWAIVSFCKKERLGNDKTPGSVEPRHAT